jgi:hypothetical protein
MEVCAPFPRWRPLESFAVGNALLNQEFDAVSLGNLRPRFLRFGFGGFIPPDFPPVLERGTGWASSIGG